MARKSTPFPPNYKTVDTCQHCKNCDLRNMYCDKYEVFVIGIKICDSFDKRKS